MVNIIVKAQHDSECLSPSILACENTAMAFSWNEKENGISVASSLLLFIAHFHHLSIVVMSASSMSASTSRLPDPRKIPLKFSSNPVTLQDRQYEGCTTVVPVATWLPPLYKSCVVQEMAVACNAPCPPSTCPAATPTPTPIPTPQPQPQPHVSMSNSNPNSDSSGSQSGSQSNTSSDASVNVSGGGGGGSDHQNTAIIVGVTIGAVVLLMLIVVLAVRGARRRRRRIPRSEGSGGGNALAQNYLMAGVQPAVRKYGIFGHQDERSAGVGGGGEGILPRGGDGKRGAERAPRRDVPGDGNDKGAQVSAGVGRNTSKASNNRAAGDIPRGMPPASTRLPGPQPPAEVRKADIRPREPSEQRHSRRASHASSSRSRYRPGDHGEHSENDMLYSPGSRLERVQRRRQRRGEGGGLSADGDHISPRRRVGREEGIADLTASPVRVVSARMGDVGELDSGNEGVQSPLTGRWRNGRPYIPHGQRRAEGNDDIA